MPFFKHLLSLRSCFFKAKTQLDENNPCLKVCQTYYMSITQKRNVFFYTNAHHTIIQNTRKSTQRNVGTHNCDLSGYRSKLSVRERLAGVVYNVTFLVYKTWIQWRIFYELLSYFMVSNLCITTFRVKSLSFEYYVLITPTNFCRSQVHSFRPK